MLSVFIKVLTSVALLGISLSMHAQKWLQGIVNENPDVIDSIVVNRQDVYANQNGYSSYRIYYHQPLVHANPEGEQMQLRAVMLIRKGTNMETALMECNVSGYNLGDVFWNTPSVYMGSRYYPNGTNEVALQYKGNWIGLEHRYFGESLPKNYWRRLEYCTAEEAAADFHALITALKTSLKGKWVVSGISKGGIAVAKQHAFYPEDADLFMPYSAPFCDGVADPSMMAYWTTYSWTDDLRNEVKAFQRQLIKNKQVYQYFKSWNQSGFPGHSANFWRAKYLQSVATMDFSAHAYWSRQALKDSLAITKTRKQVLMNQGNSSDYLDALMVFYSTISSYEAWDFILSDSKAAHRGQQVVPVKDWIHRVFRPVSIDKSKWDPSSTAFYYQTLHEEGYFGLDFTYLFDADEQQLAEQCNREWAAGGASTFNNPFNEQVEYDSTIRTKVLMATRRAKKPIIYFYGSDDAWTGAAIPDDCIDNQMAYKYILNAQSHMACIDKTSGKLKTELWNLVDQLLNTPAEIKENVKIEKSNNESLYNLQGRRITSPQRGINIVNGKKVLVR